MIKARSSNREPSDASLTSLMSPTSSNVFRGSTCLNYSGEPSRPNPACLLAAQLSTSCTQYLGPNDLAKGDENVLGSKDLVEASAATLHAVTTLLVAAER